MRRIAVLLVLFALPALADDITGKARVIDGDTIDIDGLLHKLPPTISASTPSPASGPF
jgi:hypothetical protein